MTTFDQISLRIIQEQELIIGPIAWYEAKKVKGLQVNFDKREVVINNGEVQTIENLVKQYEKLFGRASIEVCKEAIKDLKAEVPAEQIPESLR